MTSHPICSILEPLLPRREAESELLHIRAFPFRPRKVQSAAGEKNRWQSPIVLGDLQASALAAHFDTVRAPRSPWTQERFRRVAPRPGGLRVDGPCVYRPSEKT